MHIGFMSLHPVTLPLGNELLNALAETFKYSMLVYGNIIRPEMVELLEVIRLS